MRAERDQHLAVSVGHARLERPRRLVLVPERLNLVGPQPLPGHPAVPTGRRPAHAERILARKHDLDGRLGRGSQPKTPVEPPLALLNVALIRRHEDRPAFDSLDNDVPTGTRIDLHLLSGSGASGKQATNEAKESKHAHLPRRQRPDAEQPLVGTDQIVACSVLGRERASVSGPTIRQLRHPGRPGHPNVAGRQSDKHAPKVVYRPRLARGDHGVMPLESLIFGELRGQPLLASCPLSQNAAA